MPVILSAVLFDAQLCYIYIRMPYGFVVFYHVHTIYTHIVGTPFSDTATHDSNELAYTSSTDQFLADNLLYMP